MRKPYRVSNSTAESPIQKRIIYNYWTEAIFFVAERISKYCLARESFWPLRSWSHIFTQWGWFIPFCPDEFPGQYKSRWKRAISLLIFFEQDGPILLFSLTPVADHPSPRGENIQFMDRCFLGNHSIIICSSLLDQRIPEASKWMFNSAYDITTQFLLWYQQFNSCSDFSNSILGLTSATQFLLWLQQLNSWSDISNSILGLTSATQFLVWHQQLNSCSDFSNSILGLTSQLNSCFDINSSILGLTSAT